MRFPSITTPLPTTEVGANLFHGRKKSGERNVAKIFTTDFSTGFPLLTGAELAAAKSGELVPVASACEKPRLGAAIEIAGVETIATMRHHPAAI